MNNKKRIFWIFALCILLLTGCGGKAISLQDIPIHPQVKDFSSNGSFKTHLPWKVSDSKLESGPYEGYTVGGPAYYIFDDNINLEIDTYYKDTLSELGWKTADSITYFDEIGFQFRTGQAWVKGQQVIYLIIYPHPLQPNNIILAIHLLTK